MTVCVRYRLLAVLIGLAVVVIACGGEPSLTGSDLGKEPARDFTLTDQRGQQVSLSQFQGKVVVLTFIYTNCPDVCPLIAEHYRAAYEQLPDEMRDRVALVAVTVDPERDSPEALQAFSAQHRLADNPHWFALTGDRSTLEQVWRDYYIDPGAIMGSETGHHHHEGAASTPSAGDGGTLAHTDAIFIIDREGRERVLMRSSDGPDVLADNIEALAG